MRLSEAIRLGSMLTAQAFGASRVRDEHGVVGTCALTAASDAGYVLWSQEMLDVVTCPVCDVAFYRYPLIVHLNDAHRWTREQIADVVECWEQAEVVLSCPVLVGSHST